MGSQSINVRVDYPALKNEDIRLIQEVVAYHLLTIFKAYPINLRGFNQYDVKINVDIRPVINKPSQVSVFVDESRGINGASNTESGHK